MPAMDAAVQQAERDPHRTQPSEKTSQPSDAERAQELYAEQVRLLYDQIPLGLAGTFLNAILVVAAEWTAISPAVLLTWLTSIMLITGGRTVLWWRYRNASPTVQEAGRWGAWCIVGTALSGLAWGMAGVTLFSEDSMMLQVFLIFVLGGMVIGGTIVLPSVPLAYLTFIPFVVLPLAGKFVLMGTLVHLIMGAMLGLFMVIALGAARRVHRTILASLALRFENRDLVVHLLRAKDTLAEEVAVRKRSEEALHESREQLLEIWQNSAAIMFIKDRQGRYLDINPLFLRLLHLSRDQILGKTDADIFTPEQAAAFRANDLTVFEADRPLEFEEVAEHQDGPHTSIVCKFPLRDAQGRAHAICGIVTDITERRRMEESLRESERHLRAILDGALDAVVSMDDQGVITDWNPRAEAIFGWSRSKAIGRTLAETIIPSQYREQHRNGLKRFLETGEGPVLNRRIEISALRRDGSEFPVELSVSARKEGLVHRFTAFIADVTERKQMERHAKRIEQLALLGQLLSGIAHELKNPLFILSGHVQLFREKLAQREYDALPEDLGRIKAAVDRMKHITERFLHLARPAPQRREPCSIEAVLRQTLDFLENELARNQIKVRTVFQPSVPAIQSDPRQLQEVFLNLVLNAMQAMAAARGRGVLTVTSACVDGWIEVRIQDNGPGIPMEHRARLFEPFFSTKPPDQGTGLGLWTVRSVLMALGGAVQYETEAGIGTTFIVRLPDGSRARPAA